MIFLKALAVGVVSGLILAVLWDNLWRFNAGMHCCGVNGAIPVVVPMRWTGDTPMIMMTDTSLPGLGTFTVRVFFYGDRYAGTWQHGAVGGQMSGRIEKQTHKDR